MYTLRVRFNTGGKSYDFASMLAVTSLTTQVRCNRVTDYETVVVVSCVLGLTKMCKRWKSGGDVTPEQHIKYDRKTAMTYTPPNRIPTVTEIITACDTLKRVQGLPQIAHLGFSINGNLFYARPDSLHVAVSVAPTHSNIEEMLSDSSRKKRELEAKMSELMGKVEELKSQIGEL